MDKVITIIESSFMAELLKDLSITDISYNGQSLFYFSSTKGRQFYKEIDKDLVYTFLRNVADYANNRFSYSDTFLDISVGKYRLSALHFAQSRFRYRESLSFALRINQDFLKRHPNYIGEELQTILKEIMLEKRSIIISGTTGVGKTTLQKYLLMLLKESTRVLVIDNVLELGEVHDLNPKLDLTLWQTTTNNESEIRTFVQRALRFHPDYLIIAESRGGEMKEIVQGAISGHPNIVTIHADQPELVYERVAYLASMSQSEPLFKAYPYVIHLSKKEQRDGSIRRFISKILHYDVSSAELMVIYEEKP